MEGVTHLGATLKGVAEDLQWFALEISKVVARDLLWHYRRRYIGFTEIPKQIFTEDLVVGEVRGGRGFVVEGGWWLRRFVVEGGWWLRGFAVVACCFRGGMCRGGP